MNTKRKTFKVVLASLVSTALLAVSFTAGIHSASAQVVCQNWVRGKSCTDLSTPPKCFAVKHNLWACNK
ncbi:hypothetical protein ACFQY8_07575 [Alloscardovia venturai]|uniref:Uncharacterized protein n=1 Tax=Alloscardovia venturai TaxID=1769421 RepID=A0ABW2Y5S3_9BIFI